MILLFHLEFTENLVNVVEKKLDLVTSCVYEYILNGIEYIFYIYREYTCLYLEKFYIDYFTATKNLYDTSNLSINLTK